MKKNTAHKQVLHSFDLLQIYDLQKPTYIVP